MFLQDTKTKKNMANNFRLLIQTPNKICFDEKINQIDFCSERGKLSILPNHCSIMGCLCPSPLTIHLLSKKKKIIICNQGFFRFDNNELIILTNFFSYLENFDKKLFLQQKEKLTTSLKKITITQKIYEKIDKDLKFFLSSTKKILRK